MTKASAFGMTTPHRYATEHPKLAPNRRDAESMNRIIAGAVRAQAGDLSASSSFVS